MLPMLLLLQKEEEKTNNMSLDPQSSPQTCSLQTLPLPPNLLTL
jgi:hypothetical protein